MLFGILKSILSSSGKWINLLETIFLLLSVHEIQKSWAHNLVQGWAYYSLSWNIPSHDPPTYTSHVDETTEMNHHIELVCEDGGRLTDFLPKLASNPNPPDLYFPSSWDYR